MPEKNVLFISRNFPPLTGGMENLAWMTYGTLKKCYNVTVIGPQGCRNIAAPEDLAIECSHNAILFLLQALYFGLFLCFKRKFYLCVGGSGLVSPILFALAKIYNIFSITFVHGLDLVVDNAIYKNIFIPCIRNCDIVIANSNNTAKLALSAGVKSKRIAILFPGVTYPPKHVNNDTLFRDKHDLQDRPIILSVGRLIKRKGLVEFVNFAMPTIVRAHPNCILVIIGSEAKNALKKEKRSINSEIFEAAKALKLDNNILTLGIVDEKELHNAYSSANLFVFPVLDIPGDVEGFGMVALEAAAYGLPTFGFNSGGLSDAIINDKTGVLVSTGDYKSLSLKIIEHLRNSNKKLFQNNCQNFAKSMSWGQYEKKLNSIVRTIEHKS